MVYIIGAESCASRAMIPGLEAREYLEKGLLIELKPDAPWEKDMYWHVSSALQDAIVEIWPAAGFVDGNLSFHSSLRECDRA